jgi:hypothetical protein
MTLVIVRNGCSSIGGEGVNRDMVRENKCDWCRLPCRLWVFGPLLPTAWELYGTIVEG